ncbi:hypothetical protein EAG_14746 [Camponotus floridanus]|uniref:Uncharacterized protein n=1 Tax=Camponotus floridanus TaxID=104421 RepID=E2A980_CAMFO|nr:hypothetical protein EAG_14746 [Camponotus floridanus]
MRPKDNSQLEVWLLRTVDWYAGYEQFVKRNLTLLPHQQAAQQQQDEQSQQLAPPQQTDIMTSMFEQQIKSEPMGFYSVASSRSDGSNSISSGAGTPGTGFESPVCDLRYSEGPSSLDGLAGAKGTGIAAEIASLAKQNNLQLPLPLLHPQTTN